MASGVKIRVSHQASNGMVDAASTMYPARAAAMLQ
jgi:hypothetical protein